MDKAKRNLIRNHRLFKKARQYLVGGVDSPVRSFIYVGGKPILIKKGRGSKVYDYDGNEYIDYVLSWGSLILGHAHPKIIDDVNETVKEGFSFGTTNIKEIELAQLIQRAIPFIKKIRFVNSGTEAVMGAVRLARGYTQRDKIIKFENAYHGHADYLLVSGGSGLATLKIPQSPGVPNNFIKDTIVIPYGDKKSLEETFGRFGKEIAAVLLEPVGGNHGVITPDIDFVKHLRLITKKYKTLLIADEVITGFRFNFGSFMSQIGITPDLICLGKIIGGGLPIGAYAGSDKIMKNLAPIGKVYQASTFAGNPVVMQAGVSALKALSKLKRRYGKMQKLTEYLSNGLEKEAAGHNINLRVEHFGSMFSFKFKKHIHFRKFYRATLSHGVYFAPSEFEANFLSFAHTKKDIDKTLFLAKQALAEITQNREISHGAY